MTPPLFSVIVPTYDRPALLAEAVGSVLSQSVDDLECLVVLDGGPEPVGLPEDPRLRIVRRARNGGLAASRNTGIRNARGQYVTFLDDDDALTPNRLATALRGLDRGPVSLCLVAFMNRSGGGTPRILEGDTSNTILNGLTPNVGAAAIERAVVPLFDERFRAIEDVEWWLRLSQREPFTTEAEVGYLFRIHDGARHGNGLEARITFRLQLMSMYADYFSDHPRASAFQWMRLGLTAQALGARGIARRAMMTSFRTRPSRRALWHLARAAGRSTVTNADLGLSTLWSVRPEYVTPSPPPDSQTDVPPAQTLELQ